MPAITATRATAAIPSPASQPVLYASQPLYAGRAGVPVQAKRAARTVRHKSLGLDVGDALGPGTADLADEPGEHDDRDDIRGHQQQVGVDRRVEGGQYGRQLSRQPSTRRSSPTCC